VYTKHLSIDNMNGAECASVKANIMAEWNLHGIRRQPAAQSNHSNGTAFDAIFTPQSIAIDGLAQGCALSRCVVNDPVHFCSAQ
jgi:hypothetical protein